MLKFRTECGWIAYKTTAAEIKSIGGLGICDTCNKSSDIGYLVPVLNCWLCEECFNNWKSRAHYYPEDVPVETRRALYYEQMILYTESE